MNAARSAEQAALDAQDAADARAAERRAAEWRTPGQPARASASTWRTAAEQVAARQIEERPANTGGWFRPANSVIFAEPAAQAEPAAPAAAAAAVPAPDSLIPHDDADAPAETAAPEPALDVLPFDEDDVTGAVAAAVPDAAASPDAVAEAAASSEAAPTADDEDEDEEDRRTLSELYTLASLVQQDEGLRAPAPAPGDTQTLADSAPMAAEAEDDPAAYARREMERLAQAEQDAAAAIDGAAAAPAPAPAAAPAEDDPAAVARRELERLAAEAAAPASPAAPAAPAPAARVFPADVPGQIAAMRAELPRLDAAGAANAARYLGTMDGILALRTRRDAGQLDPAAFEAEARAFLINDKGSYWMFGPAHDRWSRYDAAAATWVEEVPAEIAQLTALASAPADAAQPAPDLDRMMPTQVITDSDLNQPLPRQVPVTDPEYTTVGTAALYLDRDIGPGGEPTVPVEALSGATVPGATVPAASLSQPTVPSAAFSEMTVPTAVPSPSVVPAPNYNAAAAATPAASYEDARLRQQRKTLSTIAIGLAAVIGAVFLFGACGIIAAVLQYRAIAEPFSAQVAALANYQPSFQTARILAADGSLIAELVGQNSGARDDVPLSEISPFLIHAVVSTENERFFEDPGFDPVAIARAFLQNLSAGQIESGASTITQQIARTLVLQDSSVTAERKLQEIVVAAEIAQQYDKNFILELYLNEVFFGNQSYGAEAASEFYFNHPAATLNLPEAAMLAGLIQAPATYDPVVNRETAFDRMDFVLQRMAQVGCLQFQHAPYAAQPVCVTPGDLTTPTFAVQKAIVEATDFSPRSYTVRYPHFVNYIQAQLEQNFGSSEIFRRGFTVQTTLIPRLQEQSESILAQGVAAQAVNGVNTGAVMITDPRDGAIRAMVGSPDFDNDQIDGQVNNVFTWQQPGSSIKPVTYAAAFEGVDRGGGILQYMTPATVLWDVPTTFQTIPPYTPTNFDGAFRGPVGVRAALAQSLNIPAVKAFDFIGIDRFRDTASRMGLRFLENAQFGLATSLGATEVRLYDHMQVYATIANNGIRALPYAIQSITDSDGVSVEVPGRPQPAQVVQPQIAFLLQNILSDNDARAPQFGASSGLLLPEYAGLVGVKTGTTNDNRDLWTMGFTRNAVVGVWMGRHDNQPTRSSTTAAAVPVWNAIMRAALQGTRPDAFLAPQGIVQAQVCAETGTLYDPNVQRCPAVRTEIFVQNAPPPAANQGFVQTVQVNSWTGLRANQSCPDNVVTAQFVNIPDAAAVAWLNTTAGSATAARLGLTQPVVSSTGLGECVPGQALPTALIQSPAEGTTVRGTVAVTGVMTAPTNFNRYQVEFQPANAAQGAPFQILAGPFGQQVPQGTLAQWNTLNTPNGQYRLRLAAFANDGGYVYSPIVNVLVDNPLPTPTPTPPPTIAPPPTFAPIAPTLSPFDPTPIPFLEPTPTVFLGG
jgi:membrane peptidoglycan carboxypeptidase